MKPSKGIGSLRIRLPPPPPPLRETSRNKLFKWDVTRPSPSHKTTCMVIHPLSRPRILLTLHKTVYDTLRVVVMDTRGQGGGDAPCSSDNKKSYTELLEGKTLTLPRRRRPPPAPCLTILASAVKCTWLIAISSLKQSSVLFSLTSLNFIMMKPFSSSYTRQKKNRSYLWQKRG